MDLPARISVGRTEGALPAKAANSTKNRLPKRLPLWLVRDDRWRSQVDGLEMTSITKPEPSWRNVKVELEGFDRAGLLGLLKDLHGLSRDNQAFLNARLGLGAAPLDPCKKIISRWIAPMVIGLPSVATDRSALPAEDWISLLRRGRQFLTRSCRSCLAPRHSNRRVWAKVGDVRLPRTYWHY